MIVMLGNMEMQSKFSFCDALEKMQEQTYLCVCLWLCVCKHPSRSRVTFAQTLVHSRDSIVSRTLLTGPQKSESILQMCST